MPRAYLIVPFARGTPARSPCLVHGRMELLVHGSNPRLCCHLRIHRFCLPAGAASDLRSSLRWQVARFQRGGQPRLPVTVGAQGKLESGEGGWGRFEESESLQIKDTIVGAMRLIGGVLTLSILLLPLMSVWSSGSVANALRLYSEVDLGCTALASYSWLAYSVLQVSFKDHEEVIGIDAIVINGFSWGFIGFMLMAVLLSAWQAKGTVCLIGLAVHIILTVALLQFPIFKWIRKKSWENLILGVIAGIFQNAAELIPIARLVKMWLANAPQGGHPQVPNYKKFIIISRAFDSLAAIYWLLYCIFTYEFDEFGTSNIICGGLSLISLCAYSAWAIKPN